MQRSDFEIEICADSIESVLAAAEAGADRVELCESLCEGGTTPSFGLISVAKQWVDIDVFVLIRPRKGNFVYSQHEIEIMTKDIEAAVKAGADGIVIGCLTSDGEINTAACKKLIAAAQSLPVTFHRAFDVCKNPTKALEDIKNLSVQRILTSGQQNKAIDGVELLAKLNKQAENAIKIMAGSGVDEHNILEIAKRSGAKAFHASLRSEKEEPPFYTNKNVLFNCTPEIPEFTRKISDSSRIKLLINQLITNEL
ncbi:MAG: copper homeostasis protein CutC [Bacteroidia bacterium]|nr:MAG: copper homeostasis protein CutC [Bacteroidia bacterium]